MNKTKARPLPPRPESAIYEVVDPITNPTDDNDADSFDEFDDEENAVEESEQFEEEYLNASDLKKALIVEEDDIPPPTPPRPNVGKETQKSTFLPGGIKVGLAPPASVKYPPNQPASQHFATVPQKTASTKVILPPRAPPQPPTFNSAKLLPQPPAAVRSALLPPSNVPKPIPSLPPTPSTARGLESVSSVESYEYAEEIPTKLVSEEDADSDYEMPDNPTRRLSAPNSPNIPTTYFHSIIQETSKNVRKNSLPVPPQLPVQRPPLPVPPITREPSSNTKSKIEIPPQPVWPNSKPQPAVPVEDDMGLTYEVEYPDVKPTAESKKPAVSIVELNQILMTKKSLNPVANQIEAIKTKEIPQPKNRSASIKPSPPMIPKEVERCVSISSNKIATGNLMSQISDKGDKMLSYAWYFPEITREDADTEIHKLKQDGSFLVRKSQKGGAECPYSITILCQNKIYNLNIRKRSDGLYALGKEKIKEQVFGSVAELISFHTNNAIDLLGPQSRNVSTSIKLKEWPKKA